MRQENILTILKQAQQREGLTEEYLLEISKEKNIPLNEIYSVLSFYSFLGARPKAKYAIRLCKSMPCHMKDYKDILKAVKDKLGITPGEATKDMKFSIELVNCIGACDMAPAMLINEKLHGDLTKEKVGKIIDECK